MNPILFAEAQRILRHAITPLAVAAVAGGWLPEAASHHLVEAGIIIGTGALSLIWSKASRR